MNESERLRILAAAPSPPSLPLWERAVDATGAFPYRADEEEIAPTKKSPVGA